MSLPQPERYLRIRAIHSQLPRSDIEIILDATRVVENEFSGAAIDYLRRMHDRGSSIATFEIYSPYWLLPANVSEAAKYKLSVASVVSAAAIIAISSWTASPSPQCTPQELWNKLATGEGLQQMF